MQYKQSEALSYLADHAAYTSGPQDVRVVNTPNVTITNDEQHAVQVAGRVEIRRFGALSELPLPVEIKNAYSDPIPVSVAR